jgi:hypothetical protein
MRRWADVGHGTMDWQARHRNQAQTNTRYYVMEYDNPSTPIACLALAGVGQGLK